MWSKAGTVPGAALLFASFASGVEAVGVIAATTEVSVSVDVGVLLTPIMVGGVQEVNRTRHNVI